MTLGSDMNSFGIFDMCLRTRYIFDAICCFATRKTSQVLTKVLRCFFMESIDRQKNACYANCTNTVNTVETEVTA